MRIFFLAFLIVLFPLAACDEGGDEVGCLSGVIQGTNDRIFLECIFRSQYASGYGAPGTIPYDNILWTPVENCERCLTLDYSQL